MAIPEVARLVELGTATLGESGARLMSPRLRPVWAGAAVAGPALPVRCTPGDNLAVHAAVSTAPAGSVLVVDVGGVVERGYFGEVLTAAAQARGIAGLVIDGAVRDVGALERRGFPVFSVGVALRGATKGAAGTVGRRVRVGGALVEPGDWVVGDVDGVVVIPGGELAAVSRAASAREERERGLFEALGRGASTVELLSLDTSPVTGHPGAAGGPR